MSDDDGFLLFLITCLRKEIFVHKTRDFMKSFISSSTLMSWQDVHILEALLCVAFAAPLLRPSDDGDEDEEEGDEDEVEEEEDEHLPPPARPSSTHSTHSNCFPSRRVRQ